MAGVCCFNNDAQGVIDSLRLNTQNNIAPIVTSHVLAPQPAHSIQLGAAVFPASGSQAVSWSVPAGNSANATVNTNGLVNIPSQTQGLAWIKATSAIDATKSDSLPLQVYCQPSHTNPINWFVIDTVSIAGTTLLNTVTALGNANAYQIFPESGSNTASLTIGHTYNLKTHVTFSYGSANTNEMSYSLWIDYNRNGIFEATEWTGMATSTLDALLTGSFTIPANAVAGKTLMRVRSRIAGAINGPADACAGFNGSGQTKDFIITLASGNGSACAAVSSFYENFDAPALTCCNMGVVPECWHSISTAVGANQIISNTSPASGTNNIYQTGYGAGKISIVVMREVNNINAGTHQFRFKVRANAGPGNLDFGYITDINDAATFVTIQTMSVSNSSYSDPAAERIFTVPATVPTNARLAIRNPGTSWAGFYWDDAYWEPVTSTVVQSVDVITQNNVPAMINTNGGTLQVEATVLPLTVSQDVTWSIIPATGVASISTTGLITAQSNGTVYAKAVSVADPAKADSLLIAISNQVTPVVSLSVATQNNQPATITTGAGILQIIATVLPAAANQNVSWSIVPVSGMATISATGLITAQSNGTVYAKAVSVENSAILDSLLITISGQGNVGIKEIAKGLTFELLPNPAHAYFMVSLPKVSGTAHVSVISIDGSTMLNTSFEGKTKRITVDSWAKGSYLVHIQTKDGYAVKKLIVE
ncbi:MAG: T9SS type A sorting domain-containing protein [Sphingobacteriales bacterium]|nr:MAG: T9SS type A sorting domain-containing protein [Sphingobacteriales bacterium]